MKRIFLLLLRITRSLRAISVSWCLLALLLPVRSYPQSSQAKREQLSDGVEHWYIPPPEDGQSYLTRKFEEMYNIVVPKSTQPFGKSVAFLAGVSKYHDLSPQLPSVHNDIVEMRDLLLNTVGFDEVYVAEDDVVSRDLIEQYIKGIIAGKMGKNDRLLFYYSGHGGDNQGKTGYMLFGRARRGEFWGPQVLAIDALSDWSRELQVQHILFIVDSCASGLAFTAKLGPDTTDKLLLQTLSGNGSRTVLTAGTADEATYALEDRRHLGNGVFTKSLIDAFESPRLPGTPLITVSDLFSSIEKYMAKFRATEGKATTPRMWPLQEGDYRGTFVFLNTKAGAAHLTGEQARALGITPVAKSEGEVVPAEAATGIIEISAGARGELFIDGQNMGDLFSGETRRFLQQATGKHQVQFSELRGPKGVAMPLEAKELTVEGGTIAYAAFGLKSPIDPSGNRPVGTLVLQSVHELSGEAFIDDFSVGEIKTNGQLTVSNVIAGPHTWRLGGAKQVVGAPILITPNETTYTVVRPPSAPTALTAVVK